MGDLWRMETCTVRRSYCEHDTTTSSYELIPIAKKKKWWMLLRAMPRFVRIFVDVFSARQYERILKRWRSKNAGELVSDFNTSIGDKGDSPSRDNPRTRIATRFEQKASAIELRTLSVMWSWSLSEI